MLSAASTRASSPIRRLSVCQRHPVSARSRSAASISTSHACAGSPKRSLPCPPLPTASPLPNSRHASVTLGKQTPAQYGPTRAAYDLKKFRGQQIVQRIGQTRHYEAAPAGLRAITALVVLRNKAIKPLLAAAQELRPRRGAQNPTPLDAHYDAVRAAMRGVFHELGIAA